MFVFFYVRENDIDTIMFLWKMEIYQKVILSIIDATRILKFYVNASFYSKNIKILKKEKKYKHKKQA